MADIILNASEIATFTAMRTQAHTEVEVRGK